MTAVVHCLFVISLSIPFGGDATSSPSIVVEGRVWQSLVDHNIVRRSTVESLRYSLVIETDPFFFPGDEEDLDEEPETTDDPKDGWVTLSPTFAPSSIPSDAPSLSPTVWDIDKNGGCRQGHQGRRWMSD